MAVGGADSINKTIQSGMTRGLRSGREVDLARSPMILDLLHKQESYRSAVDAMTRTMQDS